MEMKEATEMKGTAQRAGLTGMSGGRWKRHEVRYWRRGGVIAVLSAAVLLAACSGGDDGGRGKATDPAASSPGASSAASSAPALGEYEVLAEKLDTPWSIAFAGDAIYLTERGGGIAKLQGGKLDRQPVRLSKPVTEEGEGGLLGFVLAPDFAQSGRAYAYYTYKESGRTLNRIVELHTDGGKWEERRELLGAIPGAIYHNGGRLAIGPDGCLYATTGDAREEKLSQNTGSLAGKILRMTLDGAVPADNPYPGSLVYSYGHRNPQGLAWDAQGRLYASEHGPSGSPGGHDELNAIQPGSNYGWPDIIGDERRDGMVTPIYHTGKGTLAPSGIAFGSDGRLLVTGLQGRKLVRYTPSVPGQVETVLDDLGRLRDIAVRDGYVYLITNNTDGRGNPGSRDDRLIRMKLPG